MSWKLPAHSTKTLPLDFVLKHFVHLPQRQVWMGWHFGYTKCVRLTFTLLALLLLSCCPMPSGPGHPLTLDASAVGGLKTASSKVLLEISCVSWCYNLVTSLRRYVWLNENLHCSQSCNNIRMKYGRSLLHCTSFIISTYIVYNSHHELESITFSLGKS